MTTSPPYDVFISYSRKDTFAKDELYDLLTVAGLNVWVDTRNIAFGDVWQHQIERALHEVQCVVVLASPDANVSQWVREELTIARNLNKKIFPILLRGRILPFGLNQMHYLDLRAPADRSAALNGFVQVVLGCAKGAAKAEVEQNFNTLPDVVAAPPAALRGLEYLVGKQPIAYDAMLVVTYLLESARELISTGVDKGRASLLWFDDDTIYIAGASALYEDDELRLRMARGQGFAGELSASNDAHFKIHYPKSTSPQYMREVWRYNDAQIEAVMNMGTIISVPVIQNGRFVGILSLDSSDRLSNRVLRDKDVKARASKLAETLSQLPILKPLPFFKHRSLQGIMRVARLIPPYKVPVRAGIFWVDQAKREMYMIASSETHNTIWSTGGTRFRRGEGLIGQVWERGYLLTDDRKGQTESEIRQQWNLNHAQYAIMRDAQSIVGAPITLHDTVIGVLVVACPVPMAESEIDQYRPFLLELAALAAKVLSSED